MVTIGVDPHKQTPSAVAVDQVVLIGIGWQTKVARRLQRAEPTVRVRIARDMTGQIRHLTRTINELHRELETLVHQVAPQLRAEHGIGVNIAAKLIGPTRKRSATSNGLVRRVYNLLKHPASVPITVCS